MFRVTVIVSLLALCLAGCARHSTSPLSPSEGERVARYLQRHGVAAVVQKRADKRVTVQFDRKDALLAWQLMLRNPLFAQPPTTRPAKPGFRLTRNFGLIASQQQSKSRGLLALRTRLERLLTAIPGVRSARVALTAYPADLLQRDRLRIDRLSAVVVHEAGAKKSVLGGHVRQIVESWAPEAKLRLNLIQGSTTRPQTTVGARLVALGPFQIAAQSRKGLLGLLLLLLLSVVTLSMVVVLLIIRQRRQSLLLPPGVR